MIFCVQFPVYQLQPAGIMLEEFLLTRPDSVPCPALQTLLASYELALTWGNFEAILLLNLYDFFLLLLIRSSYLTGPFVVVVVLILANLAILLRRYSLD